MAKIVRGTKEDARLIADVGRITFLESHGSSASPEEINKYVSRKYEPDTLSQELKDPKNIYHLLYHDKRVAGFSKILLSEPHPNIPEQLVTKLERLYLLKEFYGMSSSVELFDFNMNFSKNSNQVGMWLFVWKENHRAIGFYKKVGFRIIGSSDFRITETHSNPNHHMFLKY